MPTTLPSPSSWLKSSIWTSTPPLRDYPCVAAGFVSAVICFRRCFVFGCLAVGGGPPTPGPLLLGLVDRSIKYLETGKSPGRLDTFVTPTENFRDFDFSHNTKCYVTLVLR